MTADKFLDRLRSWFHGQLVHAAPPGQSPQAEPLPAEQDPWFWSHYRDVASIVVDRAPPHLLGTGRRILDFGCGDGAATLGVARRVAANVAGVDLTKSYNHLPKLAQQNLQLTELPRNLTFHQSFLNSPLPFDDETFDFIYSWSVLEHVADVAFVLDELVRIVKEEGAVLVQIDPLFFSPFGSHLQRLIQEPWAHLKYSEEEFIGHALTASNDVPKTEQDTLYRNNEFEAVRQYLVDEYKKLNRITATELVNEFSLRFHIEWSHRTATDLTPDPALLARYPRADLTTQQIVLVGRKPR